MSQELCNIAVDKNICTFVDIPNEFKTVSMCKKIYKIAPYLSNYIPLEILNMQMINHTIKNDAYAIQFIDYLDKNVWKEAIKYSPKLIMNIPLDYVDEEVYMAAGKIPELYEILINRMTNKNTLLFVEE
jgi:hypothetical protein